MATIDFDGFLHVWNAATGKPAFPAIKTSESVANSVNWSPDGSRIVTANSDGTVRIYDAKTGQQVGASLQPRMQGGAPGSLNTPYAISQETAGSSPLPTPPAAYGSTPPLPGLGRVCLQASEPEPDEGRMDKLRPRVSLSEHLPEQHLSTLFSPLLLLGAEAFLDQNPPGLS